MNKTNRIHDTENRRRGPLCLAPGGTACLPGRMVAFSERRKPCCDSDLECCIPGHECPEASVPAQYLRKDMTIKTEQNTRDPRFGGNRERGGSSGASCATADG